MASERPRFPWVLIPLGVLLVACVAALVVPFRMIEPDDDDFFYGMHAFARGKVVMAEREARELREVPLPDPTKRGPQMVMGIRTPQGRFIRERSPGHYALLAAFHWVGLDRLANVFLAFAAVGFFYYFVRRHLEESSEVAVLASLLLILSPTFLTMLYRVYMSDFDYFAWATVSLGLYFMARRTRRWWLCALAGVSLSLSVFFRNTNAIAFLAIGAYELLSCVLHAFDLAWGPRKPGPVESHESFGWRRVAALLAAIVVGAIPLVWYSYATTGKLLGSGYEYRLERQSSALFALWDPGAVFSLRHLILGESRGFMSEGYTLSVGLARLLQGYPLLLLAPAGLLLMGRKRLRPALFLALWVGLFWGIYLCYRTIRGDNFQFMCRKLSPGLAPLAVGAALALANIPRKARYATFAVITLVSLGVTADFFVQFVVAGRGMPPGPPGRERPMPGMPPGPAGPPRGDWPPGPPPDGPRPPAFRDEAAPDELVRRLHRLFREADERGIDVPMAREFDRESMEAARRGDRQENRRLLEEAIRAVEAALQRQRPPPRERPAPGPPRPGAPRGGPL
jgi:hypothetical protein